MTIRNLSIHTRLYLAIVTVTLSLLVLGAWEMAATRTSIDEISELLDDANATSAGVSRLRGSLGETRRLEAQIIAMGASNAVETERMGALWKQQLDASARQADALRSANAGLAALVKKQHEELAIYRAAIEPIVMQLQAAQIDGVVALAYAQQNNDKAVAMVATSDAILAAQQQAQQEARASMVQATELASRLRLLLVALTLLAVVPLLWLTMRSVCVSIGHAVKVAGRIAEGDLSDEVEVKGQDEMSNLLRSLQVMQAALQALMGQVRNTADSIHVASAEVASGNQDLSQRTEHTAGSLQATSSSIEQLACTVSRSADSAREAERLAGSAHAVAQRGGVVVAQGVDTMNDIDAGSRRIADNVGTIDGTAFQTNILALNAAVEAARAGDKGRGFALVAGEVRVLAQRCTAAACEIKALIGDSATKAAAGAMLVKTEGSTMQEIVRSVRRVSDIIGDIGQAADHQSADIRHVHMAVSQIDQMKQSSAALVEQSAAAAESLEQQARTLARLVATFQLVRPARWLHET